MSTQDPWTFATKAGRDYLTPEDIDDAIEAGASRLNIYQAALEATYRNTAEDPRACAFSAVCSSAWKRREGE